MVVEPVCAGIGALWTQDLWSGVLLSGGYSIHLVDGIRSTFPHIAHQHLLLLRIGTHTPYPIYAQRAHTCCHFVDDAVLWAGVVVMNGN